MKPRAAVVAIVVLLSAITLSASGVIGIYGIVDKVVFEPNEQAPERVQVWGAFAFVDGAGGPVPRAMVPRSPGNPGYTAAKRGYLYFRLPEVPPTGGQELVKREWADLKSVAGTGQAVGFGYWFYVGQFDALQPDQTMPTITMDRPDLRVRPASEPLANPSMYITNFGVVKLTEASHGAVIKTLRDALKP